MQNNANDAMYAPNEEIWKHKGSTVGHQGIRIFISVLIMYLMRQLEVVVILSLYYCFMMFRSGLHGTRTRIVVVA